MAWNPSPEMAMAREFAAKHGREIVIVVSIDEAGMVRTQSYGKTKAICEGAAKRIGDAVHACVLESGGE